MPGPTEGQREECLGFIRVTLKRSSQPASLCPGSVPKGNLPPGVWVFLAEPTHRMGRPISSGRKKVH